MTRYKIQISGIVQGVGFRPFVKNLALQYQINGFVKNDSNGVEIEVQGDEGLLDEFVSQIKQNPPPLAKIVDFEVSKIALQNDEDFKIILSDGTKTKTTFVSPDMKICKDCISDITNPKSRFYGYFATNCTNCGPRYTIIKTLPYDRVNTSMSDFEMCDECKGEYNDSSNRRFHAQPISCPKCGPKLSLYDDKHTLIQCDAIEKTAQLIKEGKIIAIKGLGGFHIVCDSTNSHTILKLRSAKNRPSKPYALMCKDILQIKKIAFISPKEEEVLTSIQAPIVILNKKENSLISDLVAPDIDKVGCMLPYTPLQVLLFEQLNTPLIATSANLKDEPIIINKNEIFKKLPFVEYILDFDRDIINGVDDSVVQIVSNHLQVLRLARGYTPYSHKLSSKIEKNILAVGANQKNTISLAFDDNVILSPHIGDLESIESLEYFVRTITTFKRFYDFLPQMVLCDKHPNYETTKWAKKQNVILHQVQHHKAHLNSIKLEHNLKGSDFVGFIFDGTGYGEDDTLWGGEVFVGEQRKYHFKPIKLLGGDKAIKEPRRVALSMLFEKFDLYGIKELDLEVIKMFSQNELVLLYQSYIKNINAPQSSSVGRLFDAIASFSNILQVSTYEGESGLLVEKYYTSTIDEYFKYSIINGIIEINIVDFILHNSYNIYELCTLFINTLSQIIIDIALLEQKEVILSGGVFQNKALLTKCIQKLEEKDIKYYFGSTIPVNDGGISLGQVFSVL
ncbi:carbamoyltransferase HypF [Arcobacter sp. FWKO B]|uniref:carbamoyltransferase HypF n=1 Tax=Arcobacter sp. FWKO B TaxID=2593672 RepID=UPI0018A4554D|nr:carbamoyltransferase HypF [Arcobacter sp. FWKO B]QOG13289.1 carbamoyltransferase HypF [Arcobacter sp. FWKO B]